MRNRLGKEYIKQIMLGELNSNEIDRFLAGQVVGRLGCADERLIFVVPISYVYDGKDIYAHSSEGTKVDLMRKNNRVCLEVDHMTDMRNWNSVIVWGEFEELKDGDEMAYALKLLSHRMDSIAVSETAEPPRQTMLPQHQQGKKIVYRIRITRKTGRFEKN